MSVEIRFEYNGQLRTVATHTPSSTTMHTDAPVDNHGRGESFSPTDLVATAMGTCMLTVMGIYAQSRGIELDGMTASVQKEMVADPLRRVAALPSIVRMPSTVPVEERANLERTARECPVIQSLDPRIEKTIVFEWSD